LRGKQISLLTNYSRAADVVYPIAAGNQNFVYPGGTGFTKLSTKKVVLTDFVYISTFDPVSKLALAINGKNGDYQYIISEGKIVTSTYS
jgi:hypothetical protein